MWVVLLIVMVFGAIIFLNSQNSLQSMSYSQFKQKWENNEIRNITVYEDKMLIEGKTKNNESFTTIVPSDVVASLLDEDKNNEVVINFVAPSNTGTWLTIIPIEINETFY